MKKIILALMVSATMAHATTGYFKYEVVDGLYKTCFYDVLGSVGAFSIKSYKICPITAQF